MDRIVEKSLLFDFYGELLTQHQKDVYGEYIQNDLSPTEIASIRGISRQGAYDLIKRCEKILTDYENRLHLVEHFQMGVRDNKRAKRLNRCCYVLLS